MKFIHLIEGENQITFSSVESRQTTDGLKNCASVNRNNVYLWCRSVGGSISLVSRSTRGKNRLPCALLEPIGKTSAFVKTTCFSNLTIKRVNGKRIKSSSSLKLYKPKKGISLKFSVFSSFIQWRIYISVSSSIIIEIKQKYFMMTIMIMIDVIWCFKVMIWNWFNTKEKESMIDINKHRRKV